MERIIIQTARVRALDVETGDIINRDIEAFTGWFQVHEITELHDGKVNLSDGGVQNSFAVGPLDTVGLQIAKQVNIGQQPELPNFSAADGDQPVDTDEQQADNEILEPIGRG